MTWNTCAITNCGRKTRKPNGLLCRRCEDHTRDTPEKKAARSAYEKARYKANRAQRLEQFKQYTAANKAVVLAKNAIYRTNNREILTAYAADWRKNNPGYVPHKRLRRSELLARSKGSTACQCSARYRCIEHSWLPQYMLEANACRALRIPLVNTRIRYKR